MLKKLLKYDLKSVFKYWWIVSILSLVLSIAGGFGMNVLITGKPIPTFVRFFFALTLIFAIIGVVIFVIFSALLIYVRFYKNFFTDEGYLTFTLPVSRIQLLNSKLVVGVIVECISLLVFILDFSIIFGISFHKEIFNKEFLDIVREGLTAIWDELSFYTIIYLIEIIILSLLATATSILFTFCCITLASVIAKKAKVLVAVVIYYIANSAVSSITQTLTFFLSPVISWIDNVPSEHTKLIFMLCLLMLILLVTCVAGILYSIQYRMLDKKLNLA